MTARQAAWLAEMGIPTYRLRRRAHDAATASANEAAPASGPVDVASAAEASVVVDAASAAEASVAVDAASVAEASMALDAASAAEAPGGGAAASAAGPAAAARDTGDAWATLEAEVAACTRCALHRGRTRTVFGVGRRDAPLLVVGEAPGEEEDRQGEPFVGRAGKMLNAMLRAIGWPREQVFIANVVKCHPPRNRDPEAGEAAACNDFLERQIALIRPRAILAVGRVPAQHLLGSTEAVGRLRGVVHRYGEAGIPLVVTYHPAYLLRTPMAKAKSWQDLCMLPPLLTREHTADE